MLILWLYTFGMSFIVGADLEYYTSYQRCCIVVLSNCQLSCHSLAFLHCRSEIRCSVLSHSRILHFCSSRHSMAAFSCILKFSNSRPLALQFLVSFCRIVVLSHSQILILSHFCSSCCIVAWSSSLVFVSLESKEKEGINSRGPSIYPGPLENFQECAYTGWRTSTCP
jgi:hypothetical protein